MKKRSDDFVLFVKIVGVEKAYEFLRVNAPIEITFPTDSGVQTGYKHAMKVRAFFDSETYRKLCSVFGGKGRIKLPSCVDIQKSKRNMKIIDCNDSTKEIAEKYGMTCRNVLYIKKRRK